MHLQKQYSEFEQKDMIESSTYDKKLSSFKKHSIDSVEFQSMNDRSKYEESFNNQDTIHP
jgi:hypothetical protein